MDKDSIILKYLQNELKDMEEEVTDLSRSNTANEHNLNQLESKFDEVYELLNLEKKQKLSVVSSVSPPLTGGFIGPSVSKVSTYEELYQKARSNLINRGLDVESLDYHSLVTAEELAEIEKELNRPLPRREKWEKGDFVAVFIAASIGSLVDIILSDRNNKFTGRDSKFSDWLNQFHQHDGGGPIDYQGQGFGGGFHRGLSKGHDILRFIEGILMFKNGQFEGIRYVDGVAHKVVSTVNQYGNPYEQLSLIEAILKYAQHMFADLFSTCSLPFPGSSFLVECGNRDLRKLAATMYQNGFNFKNIMIQSLSTIIVETILRVYFGIKSVQKYKDSFEVSEDYSNFGAIKEFIKPAAQEKLQEMLLLSHSIVTAINIGKVVIKKSPWELNITEIISVVRYAIPVLKGVIIRHSEYAKLLRNSQEIHGKWEELANSISLEEAEKEFMTSKLVVV
jgi:hypothetical protein